MTQTDQIQELAEKLEKTAESMAFVHLGLWMVGGAMLGFALGDDTRNVQLPAAATYATICGIIGWSVGQSRAASLRLQAITARRSVESDQA